MVGHSMKILTEFYFLTAFAWIYFYVMNYNTDLN